jgi:hypothetical protein
MRQTVHVKGLIQRVNTLNRESKDCSPDLRAGWNSILEGVLYEADVYAGFSFLKGDQVPEGELPGVSGEFSDTTFPDETRREYIIHTHLLFG